MATLWAISDLHTGHNGNKPVTESLYPSSPDDWLIVAGDVAELRSVATRIAGMADPDAQVRALNTLAGQYLSDRESLDELMRLFPNARSVSVQRAIAGIFIRADYKAIDREELAGVLRQHRLRSVDRDDIIDALLRRLQA